MELETKVIICIILVALILFGSVTLCTYQKEKTKQIRSNTEEKLSAKERCIYRCNEFQYQAGINECYRQCEGLTK